MNRRDAQTPRGIANCKLQIANLRSAICRWVVTVWLAAFLGCLSLCQALAGAEVDTEQAVSAGAEALDSWWDYPWYDDQTDGVRPIEVKPKAPARMASSTICAIAAMSAALAV